MKAHCHRITQKSRFGNVLGNIEHISREALSYNEANEMGCRAAPLE